MKLRILLTIIAAFLGGCSDHVQEQNEILITYKATTDQRTVVNLISHAFLTWLARVVERLIIIF